MVTLFISNSKNKEKKNTYIIYEVKSMYNNPYYYPYRSGMNYVNPAITQATIRPKGGFLKGLSNIKWGTILNNTQKTLNVINQAIPVYYQIKPIFGNIKSFSRLMSAFNEEENHSDNSAINNHQFISNTIKKENKNSPTFFIN